MVLLGNKYFTVSLGYLNVNPIEYEMEIRNLLSYKVWNISKYPLLRNKIYSTEKLLIYISVLRPTTTVKKGRTRFPYKPYRYYVIFNYVLFTNSNFDMNEFK